MIIQKIKDIGKYLETRIAYFIVLTVAFVIKKFSSNDDYGLFVYDVRSRLQNLIKADELLELFYDEEYKTDWPLSRKADIRLILLCEKLFDCEWE